MKRFEFRLERILEYRQIQATLAQKELERLHNARRAVLDRLADNLQEISASWSSSCTGDVVDVANLDAASRYRDVLRRDEARLKLQISEVDRKIQAQRKNVIEADRRCRLLEKLKERRKREWQSTIDREFERIAAEAYRNKTTVSPECRR